MSIRRTHAAFLIQVAALLGQRDRDAAGEHHVALVSQQALAGLADSDQRGRTRRLHGERRSLKVQLVGNARREIVGIVPHHRGVVANLVVLQEVIGESRLRVDLLQKVAAVGNSGHHTDRPWIDIRIIACILERLPAAFQKQPMLGVHQLGFLGKDAKEVGVEEIDITHDRSGANVVGIRRDPLAVRYLKFVDREVGDAFDAGKLVRPELRDRARARELAGHAHDCNPGEIELGSHDLPPFAVLMRANASRCLRACSCAALRTALGAATLPETPVSSRSLSAIVRIVVNSNIQVMGI